MKTLIKGILPFLFLITLFANCQKEYFAPPALTCDLETTDHPKHNGYSTHIQKGIQDGLPGQSVFIKTPDEGIWEGSAGYACIEEKIPLTSCHIHYAASIPKSFTAIAVLQQVEQGNLSLDDTVDEYLEEKYLKYVPNANKIKIRHLLNHTSGLPDQIDIEFITDFLNNPVYYYSQEELMAYLDGKDPLWEPGTQYYYSDANYNILILILDIISGDHIQLIKENIIEPLGLSNTYYTYSINHTTVPNLVSAYWDVYSDGSLENITAWEYAITSFFKGSGGMATNCHDLGLFIQAVFDGSLVSEQTIEMIRSDTVHNPQAATWINDSYGLGFMVIHNKYGTWYGHAGRDPGAAGYVFCNPEKDVTLVVMTNIGTFMSLKYTALFYGYMSEWQLAIFNE